MKPTLFILAAGMGSRYGGLKQLDGLGPNGETIMDYSVYDAVRAGFGKIVFVIRHSFEKDFLQAVVSKYREIMPVEIVFQEVEYVPEGISYNEKREKPWGTNHAVMMGEDVIHEPFGVINADDFYGKESFEVLADFLRSVENSRNEYCMVGYRVGNTLSESGAVSRGICVPDENGYLTSVVERTHIEEKGGTIVFLDEHGVENQIAPETPVSMNMWGFTPDYFAYSKESFTRFLKVHGDNIKSEFYIPTVVNELITERAITCKVLDTAAKWFGVTYAEDRPQVVLKINELIRKGVYPNVLWGKEK
ncbi:nucleotidyltransferase family protein [Microbacter margulisiae]|uniref:UTP-glucose-1-phosphate uridylyltransferase n=1 Tax=Microbacter margulisiae TaxID=1350067 RepID=A0A7W5DPI4_9PORP|nr:nucleotidyltransferase [Microbacter margulisiae]MBB3186368.1 UTP-glucose-1-phosphate uridylyltransferase [Microbacter margulisiae]